MRFIKWLISIVVALTANYFILKWLSTSVIELLRPQDYSLFWFVTFHIVMVPIFVDYILYGLVRMIIDKEFRESIGNGPDRTFAEAIDDLLDIGRTTSQDWDVWRLQEKGQWDKASRVRAQYNQENYLKDIERSTRR